jgi:GNAT superfamily N-acetyltransferase
LASAYYREGEDADTPQEKIDAFIRFLFDKIVNREIYGYIAKDKYACVGFALWGIDAEGFEFSEIPGFGTILEIGFIPSYRAKGNGKELVTHIERCLCKKSINNCYVSAYGPAQKFWSNCGYVENGKLASNGLPIMVKSIS